MHIELVEQAEKESLRDLLLLADEQWGNVERYLGRAHVYALYEKDVVRAECAVTNEGDGLAEIQSLAVEPACQRQGFGRELVAYALRRCRGRYTRLRVRTGDSPQTVPFYQSCGFEQVARLEGDILARYGDPIYEAGKLLADTLVFEQPVPPARPATRVFTADLHLGSRAVARWRGFGEDVQAHDDVVLANLERALLPDDELWILGDVCRPRIQDVRHLRAALPCQRVNTVVGNHDARSKFATAGGFGKGEYYAHVGKVRREG